jgi:hypothetical protein
MDLLNHRKGGMLFYQVFLLSPLQSQYRTEEIVRGCVSLKKNKSQSRRCRGDCE